MQTRYRAAATALLLTATAGLAATGGAAAGLGHAPHRRQGRSDAHRHHQVQRQGRRSCRTAGSGPATRCSRSCAGSTEAACIQVLRLKKGYTLTEASATSARRSPTTHRPTSPRSGGSTRTSCSTAACRARARAPAQQVGREHRQGRQVLRREPRQEHADDVQGQGRPPEARHAERGRPQHADHRRRRNAFKARQAQPAQGLDEAPRTRPAEPHFVGRGAGQEGHDPDRTSRTAS